MIQFSQIIGFLFIRMVKRLVCHTNVLQKISGSERREDVLNEATKKSSQFLVGDVVDVSHYEQQELFLEGTGSMFC